VTVVLASVTPWVGMVAMETACVAGKLLMETEDPIVTVTFSKAERLAESSATVPVTVVEAGKLTTVTLAANDDVMTGVVRVTTVGVSVMQRYIDSLIQL